MLMCKLIQSTWRQFVMTANNVSTHHELAPMLTTGLLCRVRALEGDLRRIWRMLVTLEVIVCNELCLASRCTFRPSGRAPRLVAPALVGASLTATDVNDVDRCIQARRSAADE